ncbi:protein NO VEIN domain-containing protein [Streptomyces sp. NPDC085639]|uniref:protein NO VEIN domain-containing protein n=1 Tax=Streptomyces sp. NPDC085639 TaxID=3365734 RepID=UPI0037D8A916
MATNEIERIAVTLAVEYEHAQGRQVTDVGNGWPPGLGLQVQQWTSSRRVTCDLVSRNPDGSLARLIEVKGRGGPTSVSICDRQHSAMMGCGKDWWLYVALECRTSRPKLVVVREPARLPWRRLPGAVGTPHGRPRVRDEGDWHVSQNDILTLSHAHTSRPPQFIQNPNK